MNEKERAQQIYRDFTTKSDALMAVTLIRRYCDTKVMYDGADAFTYWTNILEYIGKQKEKKGGGDGERPIIVINPN